VYIQLLWDFSFSRTGHTTEKKVVGNQIDTLVDSFSEDFIFFAGQTDSGEVLTQKNRGNYFCYKSS